VGRSYFIEAVYQLKKSAILLAEIAAYWKYNDQGVGISLYKFHITGAITLSSCRAKQKPGRNQILSGFLFLENENFLTWLAIGYTLKKKGLTIFR